MSLLDLTTAAALRVANQDARAVMIGGDVVFQQWTETRRNLAPSPRGTNLAVFACSLGTLTAITDDPQAGILFTRTAGGSSRALEIRIGPDLVPAGRQVTFKCEVMTPNSLTCNLRANTSNSSLSYPVTPPTVPALPNEWQSYECTVNLPSTWVANTYAGFLFIASAGAVGQEIRYRNFQVEFAPPPLGAFFYGDTPDTSAKRYSWAGAVDNSASIEQTGEGYA